MIVVNGHISTPRVPRIPGLDQWNRTLHHTAAWRSAEEYQDKVSSSYFSSNYVEAPKLCMALITVSWVSRESF